MFLLFLISSQMHHPIQMKPADSENRNGKSLICFFFHSYFSLKLWFLFSCNLNKLEVSCYCCCCCCGSCFVFIYFRCVFIRREKKRSRVFYTPLHFDYLSDCCCYIAVASVFSFKENFQLQLQYYFACIFQQSPVFLTFFVIWIFVVFPNQVDV